MTGIDRDFIKDFAIATTILASVIGVVFTCIAIILSLAYKYFLGV